MAEFPQATSCMTLNGVNTTRTGLTKLRYKTKLTSKFSQDVNACVDRFQGCTTLRAPIALLHKMTAEMRGLS